MDVAQRFQRLDVNVNLAFIVGGAAPVNVPVSNVGLEGRGGPQIERLGGLHVIVPVKKHGRFAGRVQRFSVDQGMQLGGNDLDIFKARRCAAFPPPIVRPARYPACARFWC